MVSKSPYMWFRLLDVSQSGNSASIFNLQGSHRTQILQRDCHQVEEQHCQEVTHSWYNSKPDSLGFRSNDAKADWASFTDTIYASATEVIGTSTHKHQDLFDEMLLTFKNCWKRYTIFTEPFSVTLHQPQKRLHIATLGEKYRRYSIKIKPCGWGRRLMRFGCLLIVRTWTYFTVHLKLSMVQPHQDKLLSSMLMGTHRSLTKEML